MKRGSRMFKKKESKKTEEQLKSSAVASKKRKVLEARDLWIDYFSDTLSTMIGMGDEENKSTDDLMVIVSQASLVAEKALKETEERFPGL